MPDKRDALDMASWPIGAIDTELEYLVDLYYPSLDQVNIAGLLRDPLLERIAIVSSFGTESVVLLHYVSQIRPECPVLFLETHKHFPETIEYRDHVTNVLNLNLQVISPDAALVHR